MMDINDLEVRNLLIDQFHIDTVLLIEKRLEAERVIEVERPRGASVVSYREIKLSTCVYIYKYYCCICIYTSVLCSQSLVFLCIVSNYVICMA